MIPNSMTVSFPIKTWLPCFKSPFEQNRLGCRIHEKAFHVSFFEADIVIGGLVKSRNINNALLNFKSKSVSPVLLQHLPKEKSAERKKASRILATQTGNHKN